MEEEWFIGKEFLLEGKQKHYFEAKTPRYSWRIKCWR